MYFTTFFSVPHQGSSIQITPRLQITPPSKWGLEKCIFSKILGSNLQFCRYHTSKKIEKNIGGTLWFLFRKFNQIDILQKVTPYFLYNSLQNANYFIFHMGTLCIFIQESISSQEIVQRQISESQHINIITTNFWSKFSTDNPPSKWKNISEGGYLYGTALMA